ncbi:MAG: TatD family hydrolase [Candidatus Heimdallarchaeota archaeon]|nr:TatD family hydrolase [Candidatus Heimdallarchaeota archaeon]MBY8994228.1 TatD family hydrolase [Candidatus Heimdallarchaeota archaeon]
MFIDCHAHLNNITSTENPLERVIDDAAKVGVDFIVGVISNPKSYSFYEQQLKFSNIISVLGIYSLPPDDVIDQKLTLLQNEIEENKPNAIGELFYTTVNDSARQKRIDELFRKQIQIAHQYDLPIVTCTGYSSSNDFLKLLKEEKAEILGGQIHCCRNSLNVVNSLLDMGFYLSYGSPPSMNLINPLDDERITELIKQTPLEHILTETDSPAGMIDEPPKPRYTPSKIPEIVKNLASVKEIDIEEFANIVLKNAQKLFDF